MGRSRKCCGNADRSAPRAVPASVGAELPPHAFYPRCTTDRESGSRLPSAPSCLHTPGGATRSLRARRSRLPSAPSCLHTLVNARKRKCPIIVSASIGAELPPRHAQARGLLCDDMSRLPSAPSCLHTSQKRSIAWSPDSSRLPSAPSCLHTPSGERRTLCIVSPGFHRHRATSTRALFYPHCTTGRESGSRTSVGAELPLHREE